jgi:hypothetical protein
VVGAAQYVTWATNYGRNASDEGVTVPEPPIITIALAFLVTGVLRRR